MDARLDESNINRFIRVLQRFLTHSQFIITTHNKPEISREGREVCEEIFTSNPSRSSGD